MSLACCSLVLCGIALTAYSFDIEQEIAELENLYSSRSKFIYKNEIIEVEVPVKRRVA